MASPPFQVEDQTDEDFFDKLVDNEPGVSEAGPIVAEDGDSDEAKEFSNLSIGEVDTVSEDIGGEAENQFQEVIELETSGSAPRDILVSEESASRTLEDNKLNSSDAVLKENVESDITISKSSESRNTGIKEVQWSSFIATDPAQHSGFGSYSDFFNELGDGSVDPFARVGDDKNPTSSFTDVVANSTTSSHQVGLAYGGVTEKIADAQHWENLYPGWRYDPSTGEWCQVDGNDALANAHQGNFESKGQTASDDVADAQHWENLYPGWRYDPSTGEWCQVDGYDALANSHQGNFESKGQTASDDVVSDQRSETSYLHQTAQSAVGTIAEGCTTSNVFNWSQVLQGRSTEYPAHMVFDPQYPGWYYDTITQEWCLLESYIPSVQSTSTAHDQQFKNENASTGGFYSENYHSPYSEYGQVKSCGSQGEGGQDQGGDWAAVGPVSNCIQQNMNAWQPALVSKNEAAAGFTEDQKSESPLNNYTGQQLSFKTMGIASLHDQRSQNYDGNGGMTDFESFPAENSRPALVAKNEAVASFTENQKSESLYDSRDPVNNYLDQQLGFKPMGTASLHDQRSQYYDGNSGITGFQSFIPAENISRPALVAKNEAVSSFTENQKSDSLYDSRGPANNYPDQKLDFKPMVTASWHDQRSQNYDYNNRMTGFQSFIPAENFSQQLNQPKVNQSQQIHFSHDYYGSQKSVSYSHQPSQNGTQFSYAPNEGRSSAGRPPHVLVTFGFGGKLIVMKDSNSFVTNLSGSQDSVGGSISILNLMDVVMDKNDATNISTATCDYFRTLCQQSFPGPLVGGNVGSKELNKWIDERITNFEYSNMDYRKGELLRLLICLLKIACQHYGKLRSPFGTDPTLKESDRPESAVAKLFASARRNGAQLDGYGALTRCLQNLPSEGEIQATAVEVQNLLVSGKTKEALQLAQEGQLWGPALVLAAQLGNQFHVDTVKQMAHRQLLAGSPLRTLCLLIAGQPANVFSAEGTTSNGPPGAVNMYHQPVQIGANCILDDWTENLAVITANRTKGDELVIVHLGDCLWKERGEITAAHICYLVAEANFESYSDSARLCLIGADHWKFPRTYASPEAIQRTELYEYSMVLGNSQSILLPFQPYKLIYAHMLAEVGKVSDSLKYCQAILKSLKAGRAPEVDTWRQLVSSLEERIRTHQQGGYGTNLAPAKLVGKLLPFIDRSINRMIGVPAQPLPSTSHRSIQSNEHDKHPVGPRVANSQSTMAMSSLMLSESMEPMSEWRGDNNRMSMHNRSISEPDFGRSPRQVPSNEAVLSDAQGKASSFGRFGSQLLLKTVGWVSRSLPDHQAKLGEKNKFYYDEKLKRWVEEGAEPPAEETALSAPPTTAVFQNGMSDCNIKDTVSSESLHPNGVPKIKSPTPLERSSGIPPTSNQFSARGQMGVRSRYVDTFNKGGGKPTNLFQSHSVRAAKPDGGVNAKFFIPTPVASDQQQTVDATGENMHETVASSTDPPISLTGSLFPTPPPSSVLSMQRFPSMDNIAPMGNKALDTMGSGNSLRSRRTASWSGGSFSDAFIPPKMTEKKSLGETLGMPLSSFMPGDSSSTCMPMNGGSFRDDLQEVEL